VAKIVNRRSLTML